MDLREVKILLQKSIWKHRRQYFSADYAGAWMHHWDVPTGGEWGEAARPDSVSRWQKSKHTSKFYMKVSQTVQRQEGILQPIWSLQIP